MGAGAGVGVGARVEEGVKAQIEEGEEEENDMEVRGKCPVKCQGLEQSSMRNTGVWDGP